MAPTKTCQTLRTIKDGGGSGEQKINPVHYLQPTSYPVTSLRENIINLPTNNSRTAQPVAPVAVRQHQDLASGHPSYPPSSTDKQKHLFTHNGKYNPFLFNKHRFLINISDKHIGAGAMPDPLLIQLIDSSSGQCCSVSSNNQNIHSIM